MKLGLITYHLPHKKTQDVISGLNNMGYKNITLIIQKYKIFKKKKNSPILNHRPFQFVGKNPFELAKKHNFKIRYLDDNNFTKGLDIIIICGSYLIPKIKIIKDFIINCHSGLIPETRGLDSIKWAIHNNKLTGNTLHFIDEEIDMGSIISQTITKIHNDDSITTFSQRHYETEIKMLINFEKYLNKSTIFCLNKCKPTFRMPYSIEKNLNNKFEIYKLDSIDKINQFSTKDQNENKLY